MRKKILCALIALMFVTLNAYANYRVDNGDGTVSDYDIGLMWQQQDDDVKRNWQEALDYCNGLTLGQHDDWRLPNNIELQSVASYDLFYPNIDTAYFPGTNIDGDGAYWTSTTDVNRPTYAWVVGFATGGDWFLGKAAPLYVRCVR